MAEAVRRATKGFWQLFRRLILVAQNTRIEVQLSHLERHLCELLILMAFFDSTRTVHGHFKTCAQDL